MRAFLIALAAIVLLTIGGIGLVYVFTEDGTAPTVAAAPAAPPVPPAPEPPPELSLPPLPAPPTVSINGPAGLPSAPGVSPARAKPKEGTWGAVPAVSRASKLGPTGAAVGRGLAQLGPMVSSCFSGAVATMDESTDVPTLMLHLETGTDQVTVVDAVPATPGGATDELMACAIRTVKGRTFAAPGARPGQRHRLSFPITP